MSVHEHVLVGANDEVGTNDDDGIRLGDVDEVGVKDDGDVVGGDDDDGDRLNEGMNDGAGKNGIENVVLSDFTFQNFPPFAIKSPFDVVRL